MKPVLIVISLFYEDIAATLLLGAEGALKEKGIAYEVVDVPGAFEIPAVIAMGIESGKYDAYVALGCVIRGETTHYDYVCAESARGLQELAIRQHAPIGYGILTVETKQQAIERAALKRGNKGAAAVGAALAMLEIKRKMAS